MDKIDFKSLLLRNYKEVSRESIYDIHFPSIVDGNRPVNRAILLSLKELSKGTTKSITARNVMATASAKYHLHKEESMYRTAIAMTIARLPLIAVSNKSGTGSAYDIDKGEITAERYTRLSLTPIGLDFVNSVLLSPTCLNYDGSFEIPEVFTSMLPNSIMQVYWDIAIGVSTLNLPLCPEELFLAMKFLINNNLTASFDDLAKIIKGTDTETYHTHITTAQNLYSLIEEGDSNVTILSNIEVTDDTIYLKGAPVGRNYASLTAEIVKLNANRLECKVKEKMIRTFSIEGTRTPPGLVEIKYTPLNNATPQDIRQELYALTSARQNFRTEYVGILPSTSENVPIEKRLHKSSVREVLIECIRNGYSSRKADINAKIDKLKEERKYNELFEKITRPSTRVWFKQIIDRDDKEELLIKLANEGDPDHIIRSYIGQDVDTLIKSVKIGDLEIQGGITPEEAKIVFQKQSGSILARLNERTAAINELATFTHRLNSLSEQLTHEKVLSYLNNVIDTWLKTPGIKRRSPILYKQNEVDMQDIKQDIMLQNSMLNRIKIDKIHCILYKDNMIEMKLSLQGVDLNRVKSITDFRRGSALYIITQSSIFTLKDYKLDTLIPYTDLTGESTFRGMFVLEAGKHYLFVTNRGRVKLIHSDNLRQFHAETIGLYLNEGETVMPPLVFNDDVDLTDMAIDLLTKVGIKRMNLTDISVSNKKGWKQMFSTRVVDVIDYRIVHKDNQNAICSTTLGLKDIHFNKVSLYKRNISKEFPIADGYEFISFTDHKMLHIAGKALTDSIETLKESYNYVENLDYNPIDCESDVSIDSREKLLDHIKENNIELGSLKYHIKTIW